MVHPHLRATFNRVCPIAGKHLRELIFQGLVEINKNIGDLIIFILKDRVQSLKVILL